jgi:uncharacterized Tic20 family protein
MSQQGPPPPPQPPLPPGGGPPAGGQPGQPPLSADQERLWGMLAHLLSFVAAYIALGFVAPLVVLLVFGPRSAYVRAQAVESLNFNLSWLLYAIAAGILVIIGIGLLILLALGIAYVVLVIIASVRANNGQLFRYPLTIRFMS